VIGTLGAEASLPLRAKVEAATVDIVDLQRTAAAIGAAHPQPDDAVSVHECTVLRTSDNFLGASGHSALPAERVRP